MIARYFNKLINALTINTDDGFCIYTLHADHIYIHHLYFERKCGPKKLFNMIASQLDDYDVDIKSIKYVKGQISKHSQLKDETLKIYSRYDLHVTEYADHYSVMGVIKWEM